MTGRDLTPLGQLLEHARTKVLRISGREAARRAQVSEAWWRQVVTGKSGGTARDRKVIAMALAVQVDPAEALRAAGLPVTEHLASTVEDVQRELAPSSDEVPSDDALAAEIERIRALPISASARIRAIRAVVDVYEEAHRAAQRPSDAVA